MKWTQYDKNQAVNLIVALKKAKFEMTGMEVVAFADVFRWVSGLHDYIEKELAPKPPIEVMTGSVTPAPQPPQAAPPPEPPPVEEPTKSKSKKKDAVK